MKRKIQIFSFLIIFLVAAAAAQELPGAKPETVGLSSDRLERIGAAVQRGIDEKRIAGAVTLVSRHGKVAWFRAQGMADFEAGKAMPPDSMFRIRSADQFGAPRINDIGSRVGATFVLQRRSLKCF